jgi:CO/xanthine dehydrogenase Mo-binding subunit
MAHNDLIGQPVPRIDGVAQVTGTLRYATDLVLPDMLWAGTLRCPHAHARLLRIETERARAHPGVAAVVTAADIQGTNRHGYVRRDQPVLVGVGERALMVGDPVAAVAGTTKEVVEEALALIEVEYEELPGVFTPQEALAPGATQLHDDAPGNLVSQYSFERGDADKAFAEADVVVECSIALPRQEHAYLEVEGGLATIDPQGNITLYAPTQRPVYTRSALCTALGIPEHRVQIVSQATGGGFGGKADLTIHALLALLTLKTGKPVKLVWSRLESFMMHPKRHPFWAKGRLAATRDGMFTGLELDFISDAGAYASHSLIVMIAACSYQPGPYDIANLRITGRSAYTNNPISGPFRGYGQPQGVMALESLVEWMADELGADPVELRLKNAMELGDTPGCPRIVLDYPPSLPITIHEALKAAGQPPRAPAPHKKVGRGIACAMPIFDTGTLSSGDMRGVGVDVEILKDGTVIVRTGVLEIGCGITTALAQIVAGELGLRMDQVKVINGKTESTPDAGPIVASRQAYCSGNAALMATAAVKSRMFEVASDILNAPESELELEAGRVKVATDGREIPLGEVIEVCNRTGVSLIGNGWFTGAQSKDGYTFMTSVADVEVDEETGQVRLLKLVVAHDCGKALNPGIVKGQILGGALMGVGYALCEDLATSEGKLETPCLMMYLTPTSMDIPLEHKPVIVEVPYATGPYGAKGIGEHPTNATPAAIALAIFRATGVRISTLPATPERVLEGLRRTNGSTRH